MWLLLEQFLSKYAVSPNLAHTVHVLNASPFLIVFFGNHYFLKRPQIVFIRCEKMPSTSIFVQILILNHFQKVKMSTWKQDKQTFLVHRTNHHNHSNHHLQQRMEWFSVGRKQHIYLYLCYNVICIMYIYNYYFNSK